MKKVTISASGPSGSVIGVSKESPEYGYVRAEQMRTVIDDRGWAKSRIVSALILGTVVELRKAGFAAGQELEGKIVIKEQLTPFNPKSPEKDIKIAGDTGITCMVGDSPIYRKAFYSQDVNAQDVLVAHTNVEAIRSAYAKSLAAKAEAPAKADLTK